MFETVKQGRNEVYGIRNQKPEKGRDLGSRPRDLESQRVGSGSAVFFMGSGTRLTTKKGLGIKILILFGVRATFWVKISNQLRKNITRYDPGKGKTACKTFVFHCVYANLRCSCLHGRLVVHV